MISITTVGCTFLLLIGAKCDFFELIQAIPEGNEFIIISETKSGSYFSVFAALRSSKPYCYAWKYQTLANLNELSDITLSNGFGNLVVIIELSENSLAGSINQVSKLFSINNTSSTILTSTFVLYIQQPLNNGGNNKLSIKEEWRDRSLKLDWDFPVDCNFYIFVNINKNITKFNREENKSFILELYVLNGIKYVNSYSSYFLANFDEFKTSKVRRGNFQGSTLKVIAVDDPDYKLQCDIELENGKKIIQSGACKDIVSALSISLNFTYEVLITNEWIKVSPAGELQGLGRFLDIGEADVSISLSTFTIERAKKLTFLQPNTQTFPKCYFIQPKTHTDGRIIPLHVTPFGPRAWICIFGVWAITFISARIFTWLRKKYKPGDENVCQCSSDAGDTFLWVVAVIAQQGWYCPPKSASFRIATISSLFFGLLIYVAYSASLVSNLSIDVKPIKNLEQLIMSKSITIYTDSDSSYFHGLLNDVYQLYRLPPVSEDDTTISLSSGVTEIMKNHEDPKMAFITYPDGFANVFRNLNYSNSQYCQLTRLNVPPKTYHAWSLKKSSSLKELISQSMLRAKETGLLRLSSHYNEDFIFGCTRKEKIIRQLGIGDMTLTYYILVIGLSLSLLIFVLEKLFRNKK